MKIYGIGAVLLLGVMTSGCATIVEGRSQNIGIASSPPGAHCTLQRNGAQLGVVDSTPGSVTIEKTKDDILVSCALAGYQPSTQYLHSGISSGVYGNIIAGGLIGWGVDSATGADNDYPSAVDIQFVRSNDFNGSIASESASASGMAANAMARKSFGVKGNTVTRSSSAGSGMTDPHGAFINDVQFGSVASGAGVKAGDIIQTFNGHRVGTFEELNDYVSQAHSGDVVQLGVIRAGSILTLTATL